MARSFVLGIDCKLYFMPQSARVTTGPESGLRPTQLMSQGEFKRDGVLEYCLVRTTQDVTLNLTAATADLTNRYSNGWRQMVSTLKEGSVDFSVLWEPDDPIFIDMLSAYLSQCPAAFLILDGPKEGFPLICDSDNENFTQPTTSCTVGGTTYTTDYNIRCGECGITTGLHADFIVTSFTRNEALEEGVTADITIEPGLGMIYPEWCIIPQRDT